MSEAYCAVPFCEAKTTKHRGEFLCAKHWPTVPRLLKLALSRAKRRRDYAMCELAWAKCKARAIEIAAGITR